MTRRRMAVGGLTCLVLVGVAVALAALLDSSDAASMRSWGAPSRVPVPARAVPSAQVFVDEGGGAHVLFTERRGGAWDLRQISRAAGGVWSNPRTVVASSPFALTPVEIAANGRGDLAALWLASGDRRRVLMGSVVAPGGTWAPEQALSRVSPSAGGEAVVAPDGAVTVIGRGLQGPGLWAVRHEPGGGWQPARRISPAGLGVDAPAAAVSQNGGLGLVVLAKRPGQVRSLAAAAASPDGRWEPLRPVPGSGAARRPLVAIASDGTLVAAWSREAGERSSLRSAVRPRTGSWAPARVHDRTPRDRSGDLVLVGDGPGSLTLAWTRWSGAPVNRRAEVRTVDPSDAGTAPIVVAAPVMPPVSQGAGAPAAVIYGPPPLQLVGGGGRSPVVAWGQPADTGSQIIVTTGAGRTWEEPVRLADRLGFAFPLAAGGGPGADVVVWAAGAPMAAADRLLVAER